MLLVVRESDGKILSRYEAWQRGVYETARHDIEANGFEHIREEITLLGNLVMYVKEVAA